MADTPLRGIKVVSFGTGGVVPDFGMILGSLGADVIKVECKENPDFMRTIGADPDNIAGFNESNRNKRDIGLNVKTEKGQEIARRLIMVADIVGENWRGGVMKSLNLDYETVRKYKPEIIYISSNGYGSGGPYSEYQAYGPMLSAFSGLLSLWCHPTDPYPAGANVPLPDHYASKMLVVAALAALDYRRRTGKGQLVDMSQVEMAANMIGEFCLDYTINERVPQPQGNRNPWAAPYNAYRCRGNDEWCAISVFTDVEWQSFCQAIGSPHWTREAKFADLPSRLKHVDELDKNVEQWTLQHKSREVMMIMQNAGVAAGVLYRPAEILEDPQLGWQNAIVEVDHPVAGKRLYPGVPFHITDVTLPPSQPAPLLGQHTEEICRDVLKMSPQEIKALKDEGVLEYSARLEEPKK